MWFTMILCLYSPAMVQSDTYAPFIISEIVPAEPQQDGANVQEAEAVLEKILSEIDISGFNTHVDKPVPMNNPSESVIVIVDYDNQKPNGPSYNRYSSHNNNPVPNIYPGNYPSPPHGGYPHHNNNSPYHQFKYPPPPHNRYPYPDNYHHYPPPNRYPFNHNDKYPPTPYDIHPPHHNKYSHDRHPSNYNNNHQNTEEPNHNPNDFNNYNLSPNHENFDQNNPNSGPHNNEENHETSTSSYNENPGIFKPDQGSQNKQTIPTVAPQKDAAVSTPAQDDELFPIDVRFNQ